MAIVTSRTQLIDYCLRALGSPLVEINVTAEQIDDIVDQAIMFFREYYFDGIEKTYYKHLVTTEDVTNKYIILPDAIFGVTRVFPPIGAQTNSQMYIFDATYQLRMQDMQSLLSSSMIYYQQMQSHLALLEYMLNTAKMFRWNRLTNKLYIDQDWNLKVSAGYYILVECYSAIDPEVATKFWNERLFKKYVTALIKQQWGQNVGKYSGITLPGGVTLDGNKWYDLGKAEAEAVEQTIMLELAPLEMTIG